MPNQLNFLADALLEEGAVAEGVAEALRKLAKTHVLVERADLDIATRLASHAAYATSVAGTPGDPYWTPRIASVVLDMEAAGFPMAQASAPINGHVIPIHDTFSLWQQLRKRLRQAAGEEPEAKGCGITPGDPVYEFKIVLKGVRDGPQSTSFLRTGERPDLAMLAAGDYATAEQARDAMYDFSITRRLS